MHNSGLDPTHTTLCAGDVAQPLSKVVTSCADSLLQHRIFLLDSTAGRLPIRFSYLTPSQSQPLVLTQLSHIDRGDITLENGLPMEGALLLPESSITLTSIPKRMPLGWSFIAKGLYALFISPAAKPFPYILHEGLYVPASACIMHNNTHFGLCACYPFCGIHSSYPSQHTPTHSRGSCC